MGAAAEEIAVPGRAARHDRAIYLCSPMPGQSSAGLGRNSVSGRPD